MRHVIHYILVSCTFYTVGELWTYWHLHVLRTTRSFLNWPTVSCFVVRLHQVWLCNDSNELSLSVHVFGVCETTGHQQAHQTHDTDIWYQYRTSEVKFLDSRQRLPLFILITQTIRIWPTSYWHTPPSWKQGPTGPTSILQPLVCCLPRTKALLSHLSDEITPMLVARWGDGRDPGPCRRRGSTWTHGVLRKRQGREGGFAEHMDACCWVSRRHLHRSTLALTLWP